MYGIPRPVTGEWNEKQIRHEYIMSGIFIFKHWVYLNESFTELTPYSTDFCTITNCLNQLCHFGIIKTPFKNTIGKKKISCSSCWPYY